MQRSKFPEFPTVINDEGTGAHGGECHVCGRRSRDEVDRTAPHASGESLSACGGREMQSSSEEQPRGTGSLPRVECGRETGGPTRAGGSEFATSSSGSRRQRTEDHGGSGATAT